MSAVFESEGSRTLNYIMLVKSSVSCAFVLRGRGGKRNESVILSLCAFVFWRDHLNCNLTVADRGLVMKHRTCCCTDGLPLWKTRESSQTLKSDAHEGSAIANVKVNTHSVTWRSRSHTT